MNERIKLLAEQAEGTKKHVPAVWQFYDHELEKFAELIVRECVEFAYKEADHLEDEFERGRADDLRRWGNVMKQHFGVEE